LQRKLTTTIIINSILNNVVATILLNGLLVLQKIAQEIGRFFYMRVFDAFTPQKKYHQVSWWYFF
jgi:hypothetical protein